MGKWTATIIFLFFFSLCREKVSARDGEGLFSNFIFEEAIDEAQCEQMQLEVSAMDSATVIDEEPELLGKWVSTGCEVRPGPEFILRSYSFMENNFFRLLQHFYDDESCIFPLHTVIAIGNLTLKGSSWVTPSGTEYEYSLSRVTIIPHTTEACVKLFREKKHKCSHGVKKNWKPHREYVIYNNLEDEKYRRKFGRYGKKKICKNIDCLWAMNMNFNELNLIRSQSRIIEGNLKNKELLLGDIHSRRDSSYKPTAFQVPLIESSHAHDCVNCRVIAQGTERAPPLLLPKPQLSPLPHGQWVSRRCEVRPLGMFLTRRLSFDSRDGTWMAEYKFHADPFCKEPAFAISVSGYYEIGPVRNKEKILRKRKTGTNLDTQVQEASLTLYDTTLRDTFNAETNCGVGLWYVGVAKDLSPTSGCSILGLTLPSTDFDLMNLEIDNKGTPLLFLGLPDTDSKKRSYHERPTSYQAPLAQCSVLPQKNVFNNHLGPSTYSRITLKSSASHSSISIFTVVIFAVVLCR